MNLQEKRYSRYALVNEMMESITVVRNFNPAQTAEVASLIQRTGRLLLTGEGSSRIFPTILVPDAGELTPFVYLCAGWNVLVEIGLALGIDLDKPERARKVGNEFVG